MVGDPARNQKVQPYEKNDKLENKCYNVRVLCEQLWHI